RIAFKRDTNAPSGPSGSGSLSRTVWLRDPSLIVMQYDRRSAAPAGRAACSGTEAKKFDSSTYRSRSAAVSESRSAVSTSNEAWSAGIPAKPPSDEYVIFIGSFHAHPSLRVPGHLASCAVTPYSAQPNTRPNRRIDRRKEGSAVREINAAACPPVDQFAD